MGSNGEVDKELRTSLMDQEGLRRLCGGLSLNIPLRRWLMALFEPMVEPSGKPSWIEEIADR
ncbi:hypothetical protein HOLleu_26381 [Holothuria leucospilota]|uniref:Uncharacterized protein n=1 Tax=Holothuria leucospilota TaxID=206669 RepID=A0A9Q1BP58_HOLLE|nr:hypothetical protein HOLleu_26381 [Holothuria leucospilota]